jgi:hypothetical protein
MKSAKQMSFQAIKLQNEDNNKFIAIKIQICLINECRGKNVLDDKNKIK